MRNLRIFLTCLLEDFEAILFVCLGIWLAWVIVFHNYLAWYFVAGIILLALVFNGLTECIWHKRSKK